MIHIAHFLASQIPQTFIKRFENSRVSVIVKTVQSRGKVVALEIVPGDLTMLKPGTNLVRLPDDIKIQDADGVEIKALGSFYISTETIDPFHLVTDVF